MVLHCLYDGGFAPVDRLVIFAKHYFPEILRREKCRSNHIFKMSKLSEHMTPPYLTVSLKAGAGLNLGVLVAAMATSVPVLGFLPFRGARSITS